jgi:hypothetical protein
MFGAFRAMPCAPLGAVPCGDSMGGVGPKGDLKPPALGCGAPSAPDCTAISTPDRTAIQGRLCGHCRLASASDAAGMGHWAQRHAGGFGISRRSVAVHPLACLEAARSAGGPRWSVAVKRGRQAGLHAWLARELCQLCGRGRGGGMAGRCHALRTSRGALCEEGRARVDGASLVAIKGSPTRKSRRLRRRAAPASAGDCRPPAGPWRRRGPRLDDGAEMGRRPLQPRIP